MKAFNIVGLTLVTATSGFCQTYHSGAGPWPWNPPLVSHHQVSTPSYNPNSAIPVYNTEQVFVPCDPYRAIGTNRFYAFGHGWVRISGRIVGYDANGLRFQDSNPQGVITTFFVKNFPYSIAGPRLDWNARFTALYIGPDNNPDPKRRVVNLDYGIVTNAPTLLDTAQQKAESNAKIIKQLQLEADGGSESAQVSLGLRYLKGEGVETNYSKAIVLFQKAQDQGDIEASNVLLRVSSLAPAQASQ